MMKASKIILTEVKAQEWAELGWDLFGWDTDDDYDIEFINNKINSIFEYGEFANIELIIDSKLNIIGGKIIPFKNNEEI